ncbi:hypothetical protein [Methylobacterium sp. J-077]|uniref:hypothetical protein n=1 Tax=Methylobacterium sp. J-077 TaxID=2836656 RepID=UPI001FB88E58|nr:hypothetical protein [Methylobacterium sp. J-077]MCJ2127227.1 hypothetical protein [Methylobacterium sp. J-077]
MTTDGRDNKGGTPKKEDPPKPDKEQPKPVKNQPLRSMIFDHDIEGSDKIEKREQPNRPKKLDE